MGFSKNPSGFPERLSLFANLVPNHNETIAKPLAPI